MIDRKQLKTNRWEDEEYLQARMTNACFNGGGGGNGGGDDEGFFGEDDDVSGGYEFGGRDEGQVDDFAQIQAQAQENARIAADQARAQAQAQAAAAAAQARANEAAAASAAAARQDRENAAAAAAAREQARQSAVQSVESFDTFDEQTGGGGWTSQGALDQARQDAEAAAAGLDPVNQEGILDRFGNTMLGILGMPQDVISQVDSFREILGPQHGVHPGDPNYGNVLHSDGRITSGQPGSEGQTIREPTRDWNPPWYMNMPQWDVRDDRVRDDRDDSWITDQTTTTDTTTTPTTTLTTPTTTTPTTTTPWPTDPSFPYPTDWIIDGPGGPGGPYSPGRYGAPFTWPAQQDWTRFMPQNFPLAEQGGLHYQPWVGGSYPNNTGNYQPGYSGPMIPYNGSLPPGYTLPYTGNGGTNTVGTNPNIWGGPVTGNGTTTTVTGAGPGGFEGEGARQNVEWGGGPFSQSEWDSGNLDPISGQILPPGVTQDAYGNRYRTHNVFGEELDSPISMGNRQVGLTVAKGFTDYMSQGGPFAGVKSIFDAVSTPSVEADIDTTGTGVDTTGVDTGYGGGYGWT